MSYKISRLLIIAILLQLSCKDKPNKPEAFNAVSELRTLSAEDMSAFKIKAINMGDTVAYNEIIAEYFITNKPREALYYSIIMANKNNYPQAAFDVYAILTDGIGKDSLRKRLDNRTFNLAIEYLNKSSKAGNETATEELRIIEKAASGNK